MIVYHGTSNKSWESIAKSNCYNLSEGDFHWLGDGIYFFIDSIYSECPIDNAVSWSKLNAYDKKSRSYKYTDYIVSRNNISDEALHLWDLSSSEGAEIFSVIKKQIHDKIIEAKKIIKTGPLDGVIINFALNEIAEISFNAVKNNLFIQLSVDDRKNRIGFSQPNCTALAVRDASIIDIVGIERKGDIT